MGFWCEGSIRTGWLVLGALLTSEVHMTEQRLLLLERRYPVVSAIRLE